jgi:uncharacterized glyoxalase superfamily protein PhnB
MRAIIPILFVPDLETATAWYCQKLGATDPWRDGDSYGGVMFGPLGLHFSVRDEAPTSGSVFFWLEKNQLDFYFENCTAHRLEITQPPTDQPHGMREFRVLDLNQIELCFGADSDFGDIENA